MIDKEFRNLIEEIGEALGQDAFGVQDDNCMALIDGMLVTLQCLPRIGRILLLCPLMRMGASNRESIFEGLLTSQLLFGETRGATFARDPDTDDIFLQQMLPMSEMTSENLLLRMKAVVKTAKEFRERYHDLVNAELDYFMLSQTALRV